MAVRAYTRPKRKHKQKDRDKHSPNFDTVFVFDTETTDDQSQDLKFGSFVIKSGDITNLIGIFYDPSKVSYKEFKDLRNYCKNNGIVKLYTTNEFIDSVFYPYIYEKQIPCVGFNLPFDLSRLSTFEPTSSKKGMHGGFTLKLHDERKFPPIRIKHNGPSQAFINFSSTSYEHKPGVFVDLKTLAVTLTDKKHINLERACEMFNKTYHKIRAKEHGKINRNYIEYNMNDTLATAELFIHLREEFEKYSLPIPLNEVYSSATVGKFCLERLGINPFSTMNPNFPPELLGYIMQTYYGGRCECRVRKKPVKISVLDFKSMYPTMFILLGLWDFVTAERIEYREDTEAITRFVDDITLEDLRKPDTWKKLNAIVQILPNDDLLSVRARYNKDTFTVGFNHLTSTRPVYYTLGEIVLSKLLTGKTPKIVKAIRFEAIGKQKTLTPAYVLGITIDPSKDNLFKVLVEKRQEIQRLCDKEKQNSTGYKRLDSIQRAIKILANATSYGIFIEMNPEEYDEELEVYGSEVFNDNNRFERPGKSFDPIIATLITGGSKLLLGIGDCILQKRGENMVYCDTDSMFVPPVYTKKIREFFEPLNPYANIDSLLKEEETDIWFYGISAKRYVLYRIENDEFVIDESEDDENYSLHGLGHLINPFGAKEIKWQKKIWIDILKLHYGQITLDDFIDEYKDFYAVSQFTVSSPSLLKRFTKYNKRHTEATIKPFNFFSIGFGTDKDIKPIAPFSKDTQSVAYGDFVDYKTGNVYIGPEYWLPLIELLLDYIKHSEAKFDDMDEAGLLNRQYVGAERIIYIGKEANKIENNLSGLDANRVNVYNRDALAREKIASMSLKDVLKFGVPKRTYYRLRKAAWEGKYVSLKKKTMKRLIQ